MRKEAKKGKTSLDPPLINPLNKQNQPRTTTLTSNVSLEESSPSEDQFTVIET